jgi:hypothetical protein
MKIFIDSGAVALFNRGLRMDDRYIDSYIMFLIERPWIDTF